MGAERAQAESIIDATQRAPGAMTCDYRSFPGGRTRSSLTVPIGPPNRVIAVIDLEAPLISAFLIRDNERMTERAARAVTSGRAAPRPDDDLTTT